MKRIVISILLAASLVFSASVGLAGEKAKEGNWDFNLAPLYVWMVDMEGELGIGPTTSYPDVPFSDIFDNLESIFTVHFEAMHRSNWGLFFDYSGLDISASGALVTPPVTITIDFASTLIEAGGVYRIKKGPHAFDMLAGVRYTKLEPDLTITPPGGKRGLTETGMTPLSASVIFMISAINGCSQHVGI